MNYSTEIKNKSENEKCGKKFFCILYMYKYRNKYAIIIYKIIIAGALNLFLSPKMHLSSILYPVYQLYRVKFQISKYFYFTWNSTHMVQNIRWQSMNWMPSLSHLERKQQHHNNTSQPGGKATLTSSNVMPHGDSLAAQDQVE